ncbi:MAG: class I SAM-dependent methyltransferase [Pseudomonadota bacterium]|nr:class I SAM-dependent methyltransferase [Pseudomonadota bacterium]
MERDVPTDFETIQRAEKEGRLIITEYPYFPRRRHFAGTRGGQKIASLLESSRPHFSKIYQSILDNSEWFRQIPVHNSGPDDPTPCWINGMQPALDGMLLYTLARTLDPKIYLEIGSGNSTKFVRRAILDHHLQTRIVSIDPQPRAQVDQLCDEVIRQAFEDLPDSSYSELLSAGDMVFIDNSHRSFQNSDVTVFFTEMLPALPAEVVYGLHDIFLPDDYPVEWKDRFYNEQYMLATYLLGGASGDTVICPGMFVSHDPQCQQTLQPLFSHDYLAGVEKHAGSFWLEKASPPIHR